MGYKLHNSKLSNSLHSRVSSNMHKRGKEPSNGNIVLCGSQGNSLGRGLNRSRSNLQKQQEQDG